MPPTAYDALKATLQAAPRRVLGWDAHRELLHRHDSPRHESPFIESKFPPPRLLTEIRKTFFRGWPIPARVLCAIVAVEMVMPIWWRFVADTAIPDAQANAPQLGIDAAYEWLAIGTDRATRLLTFHRVMEGTPARYSDAYEIEPLRLAARWVADAASRVLLATGGDAAEAIVSAIYAELECHSDWGHPYTNPPAHPAFAPFVARWWARCRARLAIADLTTCKLTV